MPLTRFNAIVLAGGRSSRLDGVSKALLQAAGRTLLATTLDAASGALCLAVVGPPELSAAVNASGVPGLLIREDPPFSGPAAAVAAAWTALAARDDDAGRPPPEWTLVLACDMPFVSRAVNALLSAALDGGAQASRSLLAMDESGRAQPLAALYRTAHLGEAISSFDRPAGLENLSMMRLLARVQWSNVAVPPHSTTDIDTWADAKRWSVGTEDSGGSVDAAACN